jgi:transcriptional regulator with XRE-family HTH domain
MAIEENASGQYVRPMLGEELQRVRLQLGMTQAELGEALRLGGAETAERTIRRWENKKDQAVSGPVQLAVEMLAARAYRTAATSGRTMEQDRINLADGEAEHMGDGVFVLFQTVDDEVQTVVLMPADLERLIAHRGAKSSETLKGMLAGS